MEKEKTLIFLNQYGYKYFEKNNAIVVKLDFAQEVIIEFDEPNKIIIKDKLVAWNFLTGVLAMRLKSAFIYNFIGTFLCGILYLYLEKTGNSINLMPLFLVLMTWIALFTVFYLVKLESFKNQIINWTKE
jgi:hypothetical protein